MFLNLLNCTQATVDGKLLTCRFTDFFKDYVLDAVYGEEHIRKTEPRNQHASQMSNGLFLGDDVVFTIRDLLQGVARYDLPLIIGQNICFTKYYERSERDFQITFHASNYQVPNLVSAIKIDGNALCGNYCPPDVVLAGIGLDLFYEDEANSPYYYYDHSVALKKASKLQQQLGRVHLVTVERINTELVGVVGHAI